MALCDAMSCNLASVDQAPAPAPAQEPAMASCASVDELDEHPPVAARHSFWTHLNALAAEYKRMEAEVQQLRSKENVPVAESYSSDELDGPVPSDRGFLSEIPVAEERTKEIIDLSAEPVGAFMDTTVSAERKRGQLHSVDLLIGKPPEGRMSHNSSMNKSFSEKPSGGLREVFEQSKQSSRFASERSEAAKVGKTKSKGWKAFSDSMEEDTDMFNKVASMEMRSFAFQDALHGGMTIDFFVGGFMDIIVVSNILLLGFQAGSSWSGWLFVDIFFAVAFVLEILYKIASQKREYCNIHSPDFRWQIFDIALALLSVFDVVITILSSSNHDSNYTWMRIVRLVRIARVLRLLQVDTFRDLLLMINGAVGGLRTLAWSIVMITVPIYVFALFYTEMVGVVSPGEEDVASNFGSIGISMFTGFRCLVIGDCSQKDGTPIFVHLVEQYGWMYGVVYCVTSVCMSFGLFNVIIAIYVENTVAAAKSNELVQRQRRLEDQTQFFARIVDLLHFLWTSYPKRMPQFNWEHAMGLEITEEYFRDLLQMPKMRILLQDLDVPKEDHADLFEICDADGSGIVSMDELVAGIRRLRGDPRRSDIVYIMLRVREVLAELQSMREFGVKSDRPSERSRSSLPEVDKVRNKLERSFHAKSDAGGSTTSTMFKKCKMSLSPSDVIPTSK